MHENDVPSLTTLDIYVSQEAGRTVVRGAEPSDFGPRFRVVNKLGEGGRGVVFRVFDAVLREDVALKTVAMRTPSLMAALRHEFRIVRAVHHPHLVSPWDLFEHDQVTFFTMPLLTNADAIGTYVLGTDGDPAARVARLRALLPGLLGGLAALHERGIAHGDLKPGNVLVERDAVRLLDFGLSRGARDQGQVIAGTPPYMPPELFTTGVSIPGDVFSLGVLLFECLVGERPYPAGNVDQMLAKESGSFRTLAEELEPPAGWSDAIAAMLHPNPEQRPDIATVARDMGISPVLTRVVQPPRFGGRATEMGVLDGEHAQARWGARCTVVSGASGVGKSALIEAFAGDLEGVVLSGACDPRESVPYGGLSALIDHLVELALLQHDVASRLDAADIEVAADLFPALRQLSLAAPTTSGSGDLEERRARAILALRRLLASLPSDPPPLLVLDDYQWASEDTRELVAALLDDRSARLHWVLGVREEPDVATPTLHVAPTAHLEVNPLGPAELQAVLDDFPDPTHARPPLSLLVLDPSRHVALQSVVGDEFAAMDAPRRALLQLAAVSQTALPRVALLGAARLPVADRWLLTELEDEGWLVATDHRADQLRPSHARIAGLVAAQLAPDDLTRTHGALLETLSGLGAEPARLFGHAVGAGKPAIAARCAQEAGELAYARFAFPEAAEWFQRARTHGAADLDLLALTQRQAKALTFAGRRPEAASLLQEAAAYAQECGDVDHQHQLYAEAGAQLVRSGSLGSAEALFERAFAHFKRPFPSNPSRWLLQGIKDRILTLFAWRPPKVMHDPHPNPRLTAELAVLEQTATAYGIIEPARADSLTLAVLRLARRHGALRPLLMAYGHEAATLGSIGPAFLIRRAHAMIEVAEELAKADPFLAGHVHGARNTILWSEGAWEEGLREAELAAGSARSAFADERFGLTIIETFRVSDLWWLGRYDELAQSRALGLEEAGVLKDEYLRRLWCLGEPAGIAVVQDEPEVAIADGLGPEDLWTGPASTPSYRALHGIVRAQLYAGRPLEASSLIEREWERMSKGMFVSLTMTGTTLWLARGKTALACARAAPTAQERRDQLQIAALASRAIRKRRTARTSHALANLLDANAMAIQGQDEAGLALLREAATQLEGLDMLGLAHSARAADPDPTTAERGRAWLADAGVRNPVRFAAVYTPGFSPQP